MYAKDITMYVVFQNIFLDYYDFIIRTIMIDDVIITSDMQWVKMKCVFHLKTHYLI